MSEEKALAMGYKPKAYLRYKQEQCLTSKSTTSSISELTTEFVFYYKTVLNLHLKPYVRNKANVTDK